MENTTATTPGTLQFMREGFENFTKGHFMDIVNNCTDDVVWGMYKVPGVEPSGTYYGKEGVQEFFSKLNQNLVFSRFDVQEYVIQGDHVIVLGHETAIVKKTGKTLDHDWCMSFTLKDGKIQRYFHYTDTRDQWQAFQ